MTGPRWGLVAAALMALGGPALAGPAEEDTVISLVDIGCQSCGAQVVKALTGEKGVTRAMFDRDKVEVAVHFDPAEITPERMASIVEEIGYEAVIGAGHGRYAREVKFPAELDVRWIARAGKDTDIEEHRVAGKVTVFDFYAVWCGPCRELDRAMLSILKDNADVVLRKVDVSDWESPVARRYLANVPGLPYVVIYAPDGKRVRAISGLDLKALAKAIQKARG